MTELTIVQRALATLVPAPRNARTHNKKQIRQIANSIQEFGFLVPVVCDGSGQIIAGHGRVEAARLLGHASVPVILVEHLTARQMRALAVVENKLSESGGWDEDALRFEIVEILDLDSDFDFTDFGFEIAEIDLLIGDPMPEPPQAISPPNREQLAVSRLGDIWCIGNHRLLCGDARFAEGYEKLLGLDRAQMVFIDPPYNVPIAGNVSGKGRTEHPEFAMASGEMNSAQFTDFLSTVTSQLIAFSQPGSIHFICMDFRHIRELLAGTQGYSEMKNLCVWAKQNSGLGSFYRSQHELVFVMKAGRGRHINTIELGKHGRNRSNLWRYGGASSFSATRDEDLAVHPTVKPVELVADAILDCSKRGGIVLDAFVGSGTTLIAAEHTGRRGYGIEIDPWYCDVALQRLSAVAGVRPCLLETGESFDAVRERRSLEEINHG